jgi:Glyoxalase-like domain
VKVWVDHLVVVAPTLDAGVRWCEATLGVSPGPGGRHGLMSTHNRLATLVGPGFERAYLEIIAIDPEAAAPGRQRWFAMDTRAADAPVQLVHAVFSTDDLAALRAPMLALGLDPGQPLTAERTTAHGLLRWTITVRDDGALLCGGALPTLIEWQSAHPSLHLPASGLQLLTLQLRGLPPPLAALLAPSGAQFEPSPGPALSATLATPRGPVTLRSPSTP